MKALMCDMDSDEYQEDIKGFVELASNLTDWDFIYIKRVEDYQGRPDEWLESILAAINSCSVIISVSGMEFIKHSGPYKDKIIDTLIAKINSGVPSLIRLAETNNKFNSVKIIGELDPIYKALGASPFYYRVYSESYRLENDDNPYAVIFNKANDALRDPELFRGVQSLYAASGYLINYDPELFPLIDADPSEYQFVDGGDLFFRGALGMKHTIAVRGERYNSVQIMFTGRLLSSPYVDVMGRKHHGIDINKTFAENIVKLLNSRIINEQVYEKKCYELFSRVERCLGLLIERTLDIDQIISWINDNNKNVNFGANNLGALTFLDLTKMICAHWHYFSKNISLEKESFRYKCISINKKERRYLAHPVKAQTVGYVFSDKSTQIINEVLNSLSIDLVKS